MSSEVQRGAPPGTLAELPLRWRVFSNQTILYTQAVADQLGVNLTDLSCAGILSVMGPMTAGRLAELTGLTTGAITGVVDRLERVGYARREKDPADRRRVIVQPVLDKMGREIAPAFMPMLQATGKLMSSYSDEDVRLVIDVIVRATEVLREETARLRVNASRPRPGRGEAARSSPAPEPSSRDPSHADETREPARMPGQGQRPSPDS